MMCPTTLDTHGSSCPPEDPPWAATPRVGRLRL
jgi:hypothetical protein